MERGLRLSRQAIIGRRGCRAKFKNFDTAIGRGGITDLPHSLGQYRPPDGQSCISALRLNLTSRPSGNGSPAAGGEAGKLLGLQIV
jgi:hypothetical protein